MKRLTEFLQKFQWVRRYWIHWMGGYIIFSLLFWASLIWPGPKIGLKLVLLLAVLSIGCQAFKTLLLAAGVSAIWPKLKELWRSWRAST